MYKRQSLYRDIKGTVTVVVAGESEAEEAIDAIEEAIDIAETCLLYTSRCV